MGALPTHKIVERYMKSVEKDFFDAQIYETQVGKNVSRVPKQLLTLYERRRCCQYRGRCLETPNAHAYHVCREFLYFFKKKYLRNTINS